MNVAPPRRMNSRPPIAWVTFSQPDVIEIVSWTCWPGAIDDRKELAGPDRITVPGSIGLPPLAGSHGRHDGHDVDGGAERQRHAAEDDLGPGGVGVRGGPKRGV